MREVGPVKTELGCCSCRVSLRVLVRQPWSSEDRHGAWREGLRLLDPSAVGVSVFWLYVMLDGCNYPASKVHRNVSVGYQ